MVNENFIRELESIVGKSHVSLTSTGIELYSYDASLVKGNPGVVVFPANTEEVSQAVKAAIKAGVDFIPRGFGTNLSGGTISVTEGLVICLSRFNRILEIHPESRYAVVQPGVTNLEVQQALAKVGAFYAPDPASQKVSTLGGNAGENSGGPLCLKYGVTSNHILGMEAVLADGEIVRIGGPALDPPGFDLRGLMVGSEGGLAIITELTLRTLPKTESVITMLAVYDDIQSAAQSVSKIISAGIVPNTLEMMDATVIEAVEANAPCGYPTDAAAVLIIEVEGMIVGLKEQADQIQEICMATNCRSIKTAKNQEERDRLWQGRRGAFGAIARLAPNYLVNDACVPRTRLPEALEQVKEIAERYECRVGNVFHAGDGNLHPLLLFDSRNPKELEQVHKAGWEIMNACVELGGTISGEHGIGREKQPAMHMIFSGDDLNTQRAVKSAFDPNNILNPNKVIPLGKTPGQPLPPGEPTVLKRLGGASGKGVPEAMAAVKAAAASGKSVMAMGAGHFNHYGNLENKDLTPVSTLDMKDIIEYDKANQFITVGTGMSVSELQALLAKENQWLPVRPPGFHADSTIGALAAMGVSGPERMFYGAPRDFALGLQFIDSQGRIISAGGKVVKNVAGYDMTRLMIGSNGTLGLITEVTWRVCTRPELCRSALGTGNLNACSNAALELMNANLFPAFIAAVPKEDPSGKLPDQWELVVGFEGLSMVVEHQVEKCQSLLGRSGLTPGESRDYDLVDGYLKEAFKDLGTSPYGLKAAGITQKMPDMIKEIAPLMPSSWILDFGCARVFAGLDSLGTSDWASTTQKAMAWGGHIQLEKAPEGFRREQDIYGEVARPEWGVMHKIKNAMDPESLFSPGRMPKTGAMNI
ncbi:FAD-binding oxidoreductase [Desulfospira joergensenii]|uniref:FAD-binding oxidoreductase n=1 Tax=Desulfospira joergensenii TaxID=53329 RepID=UPI0003B347CA|nr:FAD-binding oxidoreductase [Desulfospira joergensenii]